MSLTPAQVAAIRSRRAKLNEIQVILGAIQALLNLVEKRYVDTDGNTVNPWLFGDGSLAVAIAQYNAYKADAKDKMDNLP